MFNLTTQRPEDTPQIETLLDACFGPERESKTSYRYRHSVDPVAGLSLVVRDGPRIVGSIRYWPVRGGPFGTRPALLLGPLAIAPTRRGEGIGSVLVRTTIDMAAWAGHRLVLLVGDTAYYARFGFQPAWPHGIVMPGERTHRLQCYAIDPKALDSVAGPVLPWSVGRVDVRPSVLPTLPPEATVAA